MEKLQKRNAELEHELSDANQQITVLKTENEELQKRIITRI